jgi:recombination protein RecA
LVLNKITTCKFKAQLIILLSKNIVYINEFRKNYKPLIIFEQSGSWFSYGETKLGQGRDAVKSLIKDNPELADELEEKIKTRIKELAEA